MVNRRRLQIFIATLSLLLSIATLVLWMRSLTTADQLNYSYPISANNRYARTDWSVLSGYGFLSITKARMLPKDDATADWLKQLDYLSGYGWSFGVVDGYEMSWEGFASGLDRIGFSSGSDPRKVTRQWKSIEIPDWLLLLVVSIPVQVVVVRTVRVRRAHKRRGFPLDPVATAQGRPTNDDA
ncbi:MAG: hypothetical protein JWN40_1933 [Phycisphaerales bacterium]|nr:hypothetical protein [Phycisphaerales bacterium]